MDKLFLSALAQLFASQAACAAVRAVVEGLAGFAPIAGPRIQAALGELAKCHTEADFLAVVERFSADMGKMLKARPDAQLAMARFEGGLSALGPHIEAAAATLMPQVIAAMMAQAQGATVVGPHQVA